MRYEDVAVPEPPPHFLPGFPQAGSVLYNFHKILKNQEKQTLKLEFSITADDLVRLVSAFVEEMDLT